MDVRIDREYDVVKLWLLELNPSILGYEAYDICAAHYKRGSDKAASEEETKRVLQDVLAKLSGPQILALDALLSHLKHLISSTKTEESDEAYLTKLSLSIGRRECT